jgi:hypothetical protein
VVYSGAALTEKTLHKDKKQGTGMQLLAPRAFACYLAAGPPVGTKKMQLLQ